MTISLNNAKKLYETAKKYGIELPKSKWLWIEYGNGLVDRFMFGEFVGKANSIYNAYTTDELLEWLLKFEIHGLSMHVGFERQGDKLVPTTEIHSIAINVDPNIRKSFLITADGNNLSNSLCLLAIKLIEEGVIK